MLNLSLSIVAQAARQAIAGFQDVTITTNNDDLNESNEEAPGDQVSNEPATVLTKQNTFSKEMERENSEDSEGDTVPRSK